MSQVSEMLIKQVHLLYDMQVRDKPDRSKCIETFKQYQTLLVAMKMLSEGGVKEGAHDDASIQLCGTHLCPESMVVQQQSNNTHLCGKCTIKKQNMVRAKIWHMMHWKQQVASNSYTPWSTLNDKQRQERYENIRKEKCWLK